ncbi:uncharacterized protein LOC133503446 [Syngnathoides biaculeatus]|uniref:uncharacterized protein LOC133503446 n=1 Tax=Syngnathoides biaculeatus TaxID=300417 RepID=UPI002ADE0A7D|nr:uncharacterized protein LOC133503446 [Syngnathoides biaculeatus]
MENFSCIQGDAWDITSTHIYTAREGVAASCSLTPDQMTWFKMQEELVPHISLALSPGHVARQLVPMVKRLTQMTDWDDTPLPNIQIFKSADAYRFIVPDAPPTTHMNILEHKTLTREHGRDYSDHDNVESMLNEQPKLVWSFRPFDFGNCTKTSDIKITAFPGYHVYRAQYYWPAPANQGMEDTLTGLWNSGVLETSTSSWCTPLSPVLKADGKTYRMAHDLRAVNHVTTTPLLPGLDPHRMFSTITPDLKYFTAIYLANAFFCVPLALKCRHLFAFRYQGHNLQYTRLPQGFKNSLGIFNQCLTSLLQDLDLPDRCECHDPAASA